MQVVKFPDPALRKIASPVVHIDAEVRRLAASMADLMYQHRGVGLAAPQVAVPSRVIVVDCDHADGDKNPRTLVNPVIIEKKGKTRYDEGCLSIPGFYMEVPRAQEVVVRARDLEDRPVEISTGGLLAIVLQHEIDHLDGILIFDYLKADQRRIVIEEILEGRYEKEAVRAKK